MGTHVRDIEKMTAVMDEQVIEVYGVESMGAPDEEGSGDGDIRGIRREHSSRIQVLSPAVSRLCDNCSLYIYEIY